MTITGPCGHAADVDAAFRSRDHWRCPTCGLLWHVEQAHPTITRHGFILPGDRRVVIEAQRELPLRPVSAGS